jgi:hypothetical protein
LPSAGRVEPPTSTLIVRAPRNPVARLFSVSFNLDERLACGKVTPSIIDYATTLGSEDAESEEAKDQGCGT